MWGPYRGTATRTLRQRIRNSPKRARPIVSGAEERIPQNRREDKVLARVRVGGRILRQHRHQTEPASAPTGILSQPGERMFTNARENLLRKEVIQPHLPVRLPCYDLVLITDPTFDGSLQKVRPPASGVTDFHDLTGGVYKARERIHRSVADLRLLATPTSWGRVADPNPN